jgi:hypothetical protein
MFFSFSSSVKGQTTQTTPLIEARQEKTREFQTQLLHYFSKSNNKSNHHHHGVDNAWVARATWACDYGNL